MNGDSKVIMRIKKEPYVARKMCATQGSIFSFFLGISEDAKLCLFQGVRRCRKFPKTFLSKDKAFHPHFLSKGQSFLSSNHLLISSIFRTFLPIFSAHYLLLSSLFFSLLWQFHGIGRHTMTEPDLFFFLLPSSFLF